MCAAGITIPRIKLCCFSRTRNQQRDYKTNQSPSYILTFAGSAPIDSRWTTYMCIYIYTYITLQYITLHDMTWHDITLHTYIHIQSVFHGHPLQMRSSHSIYPWSPLHCVETTLELRTWDMWHGWNNEHLPLRISGQQTTHWICVTMFEHQVWSRHSTIIRNSCNNCQSIIKPS